MTTKKQTVNPSASGGEPPVNSLRNTPLYYADQPAQVMLGAVVSQLTFGISNVDGDYPEPVVTIAIPTLALSRLVNDLKGSFDDPTFRQNLANQLVKAADEMRAGGMPTPSSQVIVTSPKKRVSKKAKPVSH